MKYRATLAFAVISLTLTGCSNNVQKNSSASVQTPEDLQLYGEFRYENGGYQLSPYLYNSKHVDNNLRKLEQGVWRFKIPSLEPAFDTQRFECQKTIGNNGCKAWEEKEDYFQHVNFMKSDYGDTPDENRAILKEKAEKEPITTKDVVGGIVAAPFVAAGAAVLGYTALWAGALSVPVKAIEAVANPDEGLARNNWVEFNHYEFDEVVQGLIQKEYGSVDHYYDLANGLESHTNMVDTVVSEYEIKMNANSLQQIGLISPYYFEGKVPTFEYSKFTPFYQVGVKDNVALFQKSELDRVDKYYISLMSKQDSYYKTIKSESVTNYRKQQNKDYGLAKSSYQIKQFIKKYEVLDELKLLPKANVKLKNALAAEEKRRMIAAEKERKRKQKEQEQLARWRANVQSGDDTFCGPVIEVNQSMVKIAVRAQLQGYGSEAWLKRTELHPATKGCLNRNGRLFPKG